MPDKRRLSRFATAIAAFVVVASAASVAMSQVFVSGHTPDILGLLGCATPGDTYFNGTDWFAEFRAECDQAAKDDGYQAGILQPFVGGHFRSICQPGEQYWACAGVPADCNGTTSNSTCF